MDENKGVLMKQHSLILFALVAFFTISTGVAAGYVPPVPSRPVAVVRYEWRDAGRDRDVPVKIYYPEKGSGPFPIIIFSHGLGGSREGYEYLGRHWAGCGYVSVHLQHHGSDDLVWRNAGVFRAGAALRNSVADVSNAINRAGDVKFAIDQMLELNADPGSPLHGRLDCNAIGMAGHSFGGWTTMAVAGERLGPEGKTLTDPRIKAGVEMSAPVPVLPAERDRAFTGITIPIFHMTGTLDDSPMGETKAGERRILFDKTTQPDTCLVIFNGADHMTFANHMLQGGRAKDAVFQPLICDGSTAFWDAWLRGNKAAKNWLYNGGFTSLIGERGVFEQKQLR